jgi:hypothetical protein
MRRLLECLALVFVLAACAGLPAVEELEVTPKADLSPEVVSRVQAPEAAAAVVDLPAPVLPAGAPASPALSEPIVLVPGVLPLPVPPPDRSDGEAGEAAAAGSGPAEQLALPPSSIVFLEDPPDELARMWDYWPFDDVRAVGAPATATAAARSERLREQRTFPQSTGAKQTSTTPRTVQPAAAGGPAAPAVPGTATAPHAGPAASTTRPGSASPPPPPATAAGPAPAEPRHVYAKPGDEVVISLAKRGWILVDQAGGDSIRFVSRRHEEGSTIFLFEAASPGAGRLRFLRQDLDAGSPAERETIEVSVVTPEEWVSRIERGERVPSVRTTAEQMREIDALLARGRKDLALDRLQESYAPDSAFHNDRLGFLLEDMGDLSTAREYWRLNMGLEELDQPYRGRAAVGVMKTSVALKDYEAVVAALEDLRSLRSAEAEEALIDAGLLLVEEGDYATAITVLEGVLRTYPGSRRSGEVFYNLGLAFEAPSPRRDVSEAWRMYEIVHTSYPESPYAGEALLRASYLERHFLEIR